MLRFVSLLSNLIVNKYFNPCLLVLTDKGSHLTIGEQLPVVTIEYQNDTLDPTLIFNGYGCQNIVAHVRNPVSLFTQLEENLRLQEERFNARKYLFLPMANFEENLNKLFNVPALQYVSDVLIVLHVNSGKNNCTFEIDCQVEEAYQLVTHRFVGSEYNFPILLDTWFSKNRSFALNNNLYPDKLTNQEGKALRMATFTYKPYSVVGNTVDASEGTEMFVGLEYARTHNMRVEFVLDDGQWGEIYDNWTGLGILGNLAMDLADIGFGALYTWQHEYRFLDLSKPVVRTGITCLVPAPRLAAGWATPMLSFSSEMWIATGVSYLLAIFTIFLVSLIVSNYPLQFWNNSRTGNKMSPMEMLEQSWLNTSAMFVQQSVGASMKPVNRAIRSLGLIFLLTVLLGSIYSSGLATSMTIPRYEGVIRSAQDLADSEFRWGASHDAWIFSILAEDRPRYRVLLKKFLATSESELARLSKTGKFAFSIERLPAGNFAIGSYVDEDAVQHLRLMAEDLYWEQCVIMTRKSSVLLPSIDDLILKISAAGLLVKWETQVTADHMNLKVQRTVRYSSHGEKDRDPLKLQWMHVEGAFGILMIGNILALLCFIVEVLKSRQK